MGKKKREGGVTRNRPPAMEDGVKKWFFQALWNSSEWLLLLIQIVCFGQHFDSEPASETESLPFSGTPSTIEHLVLATEKQHYLGT